MPHARRKLDYSDLQVTPDDGRRYELVRGELLVTPSPSTTHQRIVKRLLFVLAGYFEDRALGEVFVSPTDAILTPHDVFVPDLMVVASADHVTRRGIEGPPFLVVEILSPSTETQDRGLKARRYAELGVEHFWIVDVERERLECFRLARGVFRTVITASGGETIRHPDFEELAIDLGALWT